VHLFPQLVPQLALQRLVGRLISATKEISELQQNYHQVLKQMGLTVHDM